MARARNIKPNIFKNELLGVGDMALIPLFESLWCLADREGRLEDRPLRIKAETFPYREGLDVNGYLTELSRLGFIERYVEQGQAIIQVVNFHKHQTPHNTEKKSELPARTPNSLILNDSGLITVITPLSTGEIPVAKPPDLLIPDSLSTDSGIPVEAPEKPKRKPDATATRLPADWMPGYADARFCESERPDISIDKTASRFRDYWVAQPGVKGRKVDWPATWRNWVRNEKAQPPPGGYQTANDKSKTLADRLTGKTRNEPDREIIDINAPPS
jgi:hypothetical protein